MNTQKVSIVIPLYNEEEVLSTLLGRLDQLLVDFEESLEIVLVDDGSTDSTFDIIADVANKKDQYVAISLSRNFGHQKALSAGLSVAAGSEAVFIIDGDLQDPPELLIPFYKKFKEGFDVVYAVRENRKEGFLLRKSYQLYYRLVSSVSSIHLPIDSGDFCMISRRVVDHLNDMPEESRYLRGMRAWTGYKQVGFPYERDARQEGDAKYNFKMLLQLAFNGLFNFSEFPIRFISRLGIVTIVISLGYFAYNLVKKLVYDSVPEGYTSLLFAIILFSGVQLLSLGILGEYILRIFFQVKKRPLYIIDKVVGKN